MRHLKTWQKHQIENTLLIYPPLRWIVTKTYKTKQELVSTESNLDKSRARQKELNFGHIQLSDLCKWQNHSLAYKAWNMAMTSEYLLPKSLRGMVSIKNNRQPLKEVL